jgi:hypothetical protein
MTTSSSVTDAIVDLWAGLNPAAGYTSGHFESLTTLFLQTADNLNAVRSRIADLRDRLDEIVDPDLRLTADAVLTSLKTQIDLARPSGAGPSGTSAGGVAAAADGVFYIVLKGGSSASWVSEYLDSVLETVEFETGRWQGGDQPILVRKECLDMADFLEGALDSLVEVRPDPEIADRVEAILDGLRQYRETFFVEGLDGDFVTQWKTLKEWDAIWGPRVAPGYPRCLVDLYRITNPAHDIEVTAQAWLDLDLPVVTGVAEQVAALPFVPAGARALQDIWDAVTVHYSVDLSQCLDRVVKACNDFGARYVIGHTKADRVAFAATPSYLVNLVTGGEDFAVDYLRPDKAYSQLYLTASKNTSLLTMINILVHEASHGYNFVLAAHGASPLLNLNTALEVPLTEGMAYYREYQYWEAAQQLVGRDDLDSIQRAYLELYGTTPAEQAQGVLCAQLETYIWRIVRYVRTLCDVQVNGGMVTYTDFVERMSAVTGLSTQTLHGECATFMAAPGYAPCYALGGAVYADLQKSGVSRGVSEIEFNTRASKEGFYAWPVAQRRLGEFVSTGEPRP